MEAKRAREVVCESVRVAVSVDQGVGVSVGVDVKKPFGRGCERGVKMKMALCVVCVTARGPVCGGGGRCRIWE